MRFSYFDSSGREVGISSTSALAFRVRTGEVTEETLLYDSSTDLWAPAKEHEIFRFVLEEMEAESRPPDSGDADEGSTASSVEADEGRRGSSGTGGKDRRSDLPEKEKEFGRREDRSDGGSRRGPVPSASAPEPPSSGACSDEEDVPATPRIPVTPEAPEATKAPEVPRHTSEIPSDPPASLWSRTGHRVRLGAALLAVGLLGGGVLASVDFHRGDAGDSGSDPSVPPAQVRGAWAGEVLAPTPEGGEEESLRRAGTEEATDVSGGEGSAGQRLLLRTLPDFEARIDALLRDREVPETPPRRWLYGDYFSEAGSHPGVRAYWKGWLDVVRDLELQEEALFREALAVQEGGGPYPPTESVREEALSRFLASSGERRDLYRSAETLAAAALSLHDLLMLRQDDIEYDPVTPGGLSRDPVLEAVPRDAELRREIAGHLDRIFRSLNLLDPEPGSTGPVTTPRLREALGRGIRASVEPATSVSLEPGSPRPSGSEEDSH